MKMHRVYLNSRSDDTGKLRSAIIALIPPSPGEYPEILQLQYDEKKHRRGYHFDYIRDLILPPAAQFDEE